MTQRLRAITAALLCLCMSLSVAWAQSAAPRLETAKPAFAPFEPIVVSWSGLTFGGRGTLGLGIASTGGKNTDLGTQKWLYPSDTEGTRNFDGLLPGDYEVRIFAKTPDGMGEIPILRRAFSVRETSGAIGRPGPTLVQLKLPSQGGASPPSGGLVYRSGIGRLAFIQPPTPSTDPYLTERVQKIAMLSGSDCARTEAYSWAIGESEQSKIDTIVNATTHALKLRGYETKPVELGLPSTSAIRATSHNGTEPEPNLLVLWGLEPGALNLMLCLVDSHA
ncbi:MAG: hypothetical protein JSR91_10865 [Proteobacteria bacterium]|nr:hypothetical protein [Pseudomonadota bacterium]